MRARSRIATAQEWDRLGRDPAALPNIGITRHVVIADTDAEAVAVGRRAYKPWRAGMEMLWQEAGTPFPISHVYPETFDELLKLGNGFAGSPRTVRDMLTAQMARGGLNYLACQLYFGDMTPDEASRSASLFAEHVAGADGASSAPQSRNLELASSH